MQEFFSDPQKFPKISPHFVFDTQSLLGDNYFKHLFVLKPFQLISLWEMIQINLGRISALITIMNQYETTLWLHAKNSPTTQVSQIKYERFDIAAVKSLLDGANDIVKELDFEGSTRLINEIIKDLGHITALNLCNDLRKLRNIIEDELREQQVMYIPKSNAYWFNNKVPFGDDVINAFPSALEDILEAGNCYALDRPTACVFHCMRILEHGLNALAKDVQLVFNVQQWHTIIEQIESKIKDFRKLPKGIEKDERLQFISEAAKEFMYFKDGWRNHVTHKRIIYDMSQAYSLLSHVRAFMIHLSKQLKEEIGL